MAGPVKCAYWMGSKGNDIGAYSEEHESLLDVVVQNGGQAIQIVLDCLNQSHLRIGGKSEVGIGCATDSTIYAGISQLHKQPLVVLQFQFQSTRAT